MLLANINIHPEIVISIFVIYSGAFKTTLRDFSISEGLECSFRSVIIALYPYIQIFIVV